MHSGEPPPSYRALLQIPTLGRILLGMAFSRIGGSMFGVAIVLFTLTRYDSPALAGVVTFSSVVPGLIVSPVAGALLDRHGRAKLIIADQIVGATSLVLIAGLAVNDALPPAVLVLVTAVAGITAPLSSVGLRSLFPLIVPRRLWERANALDSNGYVLATLVGPPAAGLLVQVVGGPGTLVVIASLFAIAAVVFVGVADPANETESTGRLLMDSWLGLRYTLLNPTLRALGVSLAILNLGWGIVTITLPVLVLQRMGLGEAVVGAVFAVSGITGGIAALIFGRWRTQGRERDLLIWPMAGMTIATAALLVSPTLPMLVAVMAVTGFLNGPMDIALFTLRQRRTDPAWMGRAFAVSMSLNFLGYPFGAAIGGSLIGIGVEPALGVAVAATALGGVVAWWLIPRTPERTTPTPA